MTYIINYLFVFMLFCFIGWLLEVAYRSYRHKYFVNPGFLVGCALPIYGTGGVCLYAICSLKLSFITSNAWRIVVILIICTILMTVIEFIAGYISLRVYHNRLWDYSDRKFNIMGIICPEFSLAWGVCAAIFYFGFMPWLDKACGLVNEQVGLILLLGIFVGIFLVDLGYSMRIMDYVRAYSKRVHEVVNFEAFKKSIRDKANESKDKLKGISFLKLRHHMIRFLNNEDKEEPKEEK